jgi:hypothetical protein
MRAMLDTVQVAFEHAATSHPLGLESVEAVKAPAELIGGGHAEAAAPPVELSASGAWPSGPGRAASTPAHLQPSSWSTL